MKNPFRSIRTFWKEMMIELRKASWPTRKELREYTIVVLIGVAILGAFIGVSDFFLLNSIELVTEWTRPTL
ncbi:MAG: preprotein translocase subunit SecE [Verrucomicrobiota bacterium]